MSWCSPSPCGRPAVHSAVERSRLVDGLHSTRIGRRPLATGVRALPVGPVLASRALLGAVLASQSLTIVAFPPFGAGGTAWVALVPTLYALTRVAGWRWRLGLAVSALGPLFAVATYGLCAADPVAGVVFWTT